MGSSVTKGTVRRKRYNSASDAEKSSTSTSDDIPRLYRHKSFDSLSSNAHAINSSKPRKKNTDQGSSGKYCEEYVAYAKRICIAQRNGDKQTELFARGKLVTMLVSLSQHNDVIENGKKYLSLAKQIGDKEAEKIALLYIGEAYVATKRYEEAIEYCEECLQLANNLNDKHVEMRVCFLLTKAYSATQQYNMAISRGKMCAEMATEMGDEKLHTVAFTWVLGAYTNRKLQTLKSRPTNMKMLLHIQESALI